METLEAASLAQVLTANIAGTILCAREAVKRMSTRHGGHGGVIVNISSLAARTGGAGEWVHYAASKGAVDTFTIGLAREVASEGIRVNAVAPGLNCHRDSRRERSTRSSRAAESDDSDRAAGIARRSRRRRTVAANLSFAVSTGQLT